MSFNKTINIILDRIYRQKLLKTNLKKKTFLKKNDNVIYQQCDGIPMGSLLAPVLANIMLTEFEKVVVTPLMES